MLFKKQKIKNLEEIDIEISHCIDGKGHDVALASSVKLGEFASIESKE
ncbi:hypothetical protein [Scytonema sp. NUACC26]